MALLNAENVSFSYDKRIKAVKNVSLSANEGEYIAVIGHNGSGKSTLAKLFNGLMRPDEGNITVDGFSVLEKKHTFEIRKRVGVVFQNPDNQLVASIVEDDVAFGPENLGVPRAEIKERIDFALSAVGMEKFRHSSPTRLSGGQKQRIAIAGVLALKPKILVLDESTAMLDPQGRKEVLQVVKKLNKEQKVTVITITHYMDEVVDADTVYVMNDGEIALKGTPAEIFKQKDRLKGYGLELPLAAEIADKLIARGVRLPDGILTEERLAEELCALKSKI
ncbi:MAG: energy-coupling factor transporter ATPase [Clostridia bacterium]|nr:energy-coupling factor transporter ATPase [Clostridia bacterium]MBR2449407.1 energy-coupling factor transporter ATPase [Clostridia bacterium]